MKKVVSIVLMLAFVFSTTGFTIGTHYCGGEAVKSALILLNHDLDCGMETTKRECKKQGGDQNYPHIQTKPCCQNEYQSFQVDETFKTPVSEAISFKVVASAYTAPKPVCNNISTLPQYIYYVPPLPEQDRQVFFQSFLI